VGVAVISCAAFKISSWKDIAVLIQPHHKLIATPEGIFLDDVPLHECELDTLPERTLRHLLCATELHATMTPKDWERPAPHGSNDTPQCAMLGIHLAFANVVLLNKYDPCQPRDSCGRWTAISATVVGRDVVITRLDGSKEIRSGGSRSWRNNNPGNNPPEISLVGTPCPRGAVMREK
jgi:hypothetical protein